MQEYSEKRRFPRMRVECEARYRAEADGPPQPAVARDLSGGGLLLKIRAHDIPDLGSRLLVEVRPGHEITPPLYVRARVVRCDSLDDGGYGIACAIEQTLPAGEVPDGF
ncbi:MAG TPA: PilZ domain-containing protein [Sedimenticola thiotaurini]|uniref:PilZ domain-containing protein n=1 Tax=Sedimenticola thiotaurini TaxID=1543721 RepID=A0A831RLR6_9GAMM|nr:PilZ domain-containing protein [Sedimenticola thiotaurini]